MFEFEIFLKLKNVQIEKIQMRKMFKLKNHILKIFIKDFFSKISTKE
jgi:hypothetical protein